MRIFRRKRTDSGLPPEIQAYNQGAHRERVGMAWLVGIISLLVTLLVVTGLFFGGRWVYRKVVNNDKGANTAQTDDSNKDQTNKDTDQDKNGGQTETNGDDNEQNRTDTPSQAPIPSPTNPGPGSQPATGDNSNDSLVRTGPDIDL